MPGSRDGYSACCAAELVEDGGFDFLLLSLPDNDNYSHRHGPEASVESIAKADRCFAKLTEAAGGLDAFLADARADPGRRPRPDAGAPRPAAGRAARTASGPCCSRPRTAPSGRSSRSARPAARRTSTCCRAKDERAEAARRSARRLAEIEGIDLVCRLEGPRRRAAASGEEPGAAGGGGESAVVERGGEQTALPPRRAPSPTCAEGAGTSRASPSALEAAVEDGRLRSDELPGPARPRLVGPDAPRTPATSSSRWRRATRRSTGAGSRHVGGGSHGALHARRLARPAALRRLRAGTAAEREQWTLRDVAPVVLEHFGIGERE